MLSNSNSLNNLRPRERLLKYGAHALADSELLAIVLRTGTAQQPVIQLAQSLLHHFKGFRALLAAEATELQTINGIGQAKSCELLAISEIARRALKEDLVHGATMSHPQHVKAYCIAELGHLKIEHCIALYLDNQLRLIESEELSRGTLNQASVYPRELVKAALRHHAAAVILAHNHPSGIREPSQADINLTKHIKQALQLVDIRLLDHLIITANHATSLAERSQL